MSVQAHIVELERKHAALKKELQKLETHPSLDTVQLRELKRQKLVLKDEINRLQHHLVDARVH